MSRASQGSRTKSRNKKPPALHLKKVRHKRLNVAKTTRHARRILRRNLFKISLFLTPYVFVFMIFSLTIITSFLKEEGLLTRLNPFNTSPSLIPIGLFLLIILLAVWYKGFAYVFPSGAARGTPYGLRQTQRISGKSFGKALLAHIIWLLLLALVFLLLLGVRTWEGLIIVIIVGISLGFFISTRFQLALFAMIVEGLSFNKAFKRNTLLLKGNFWRSAAVILRVCLPSLGFLAFLTILMVIGLSISA
ncbi:hypothetical protein GF359_06300, partial [candidate division WOR-3 bacterium]|nr:hypothetical protein [candidate division WOR-3 bacterium]MBD3364810.1 hypothetical protein [candidate division WOR-3 bacterium]